MVGDGLMGLGSLNVSWKTLNLIFMFGLSAFWKSGVWGALVGNLHICESTIIWYLLCCLLDTVFFKDVHVYFNMTTPRHILHVLQHQQWLCNQTARVLHWPACSPELFPIENMLCIMKCKILQRPCTVGQLKTCIKKELKKKSLSKLNKLVYSIPRILLCVGIV